MRGQHFGFLGMLCVVWVTARVGFISLLPVNSVPAKLTERPFPATAEWPRRSKLQKATAQQNFGVLPLLFLSGAPNVRSVRQQKTVPNRLAAVPGTSNPTARPLMQKSVILSPPLTPFAPPESRPQQPRANFYAYSFFREGSITNGLAGGGQYGGSQSGFVATYALGGDGNSNRHARFSILARGAIAHDHPAERGLAAGLRWEPLRRVPVTLTVERRFRNARPDAFAVYLAGGRSQVALPLKFRLNAFAQGGMVSGEDGGPFFDISSRADRKLLSAGNTPVTVGAGIWGGGQKGIFRIDAGPTVGTEIPVGDTRLHITADWRFRIAGDAAPGNGPALTLSTSF